MLRIVAFEAHDPAGLTRNLQVLKMSQRWRDRFEEIYSSKPGNSDGYSLPTRSLAEMLSAVDRRIAHVFTSLDDAWIVAWADLDPEPIKVVTAEWARNNVGPHLPDEDWEGFLGDDPAEYAFETREYRLCDFGRQPNGTARPSREMLKILPSVLAKETIDRGLTFHGKAQQLILGPANHYGPRSLLVWPPQIITDRHDMPGMWTPKIEFHVETTHEEALPRIHAEVSVTRFHTEPIAYTPARGDDGTTMSIWLRYPKGVLGPNEPDVLLSCPIIKTFSGDTYRWDKGLAHVLRSTAYQGIPDPNEILADPARFAENHSNGTDNEQAREVAAYVVASTGQKARHPGYDENEAVTDKKKKPPKTAEHPVGTGFLPVSHETVHRQVAGVLGAFGIRSVRDRQALKAPTSRIAVPGESTVKDVEIELYVAGEHTLAAIHDALTLAEGFTRETEASGRDRFTREDLTIVMHQRPAGTYAAAIPKADKSKKLNRDRQLAVRAQEITEELGVLDTPRSCIVEIAKPGAFNPAKVIDPYVAITTGFAAANRPAQRIHPARPAPPESKKDPYPGSIYSTGTIARATAAINDALRAAGVLGTTPAPKNLPECELITIVLLRGKRNAVTPLALRALPGQEPVGYLLTSPHAHPYAALPKLLAAGDGAIRGKQTNRLVAEFITTLLGVGGPKPVSHDRTLLIRAQSFRLIWPWLQDGYLVRDELILPGIDLRSEPQDARVYKPLDLPGLRVLRVRERGSGGEIPRAYSVKTGKDGEERLGREAGVFPISPSSYYAVNVRPDSAQTPLAIDKLNFDIHNNATKTGWNPAPLEILPAFIQPGDEAADWVHYAHWLRRACLHTATPTTFPALMHLALLLGAYT